MSDEFLIAVEDPQTATLFQEHLANKGIQTRRLNKNQSLSFTGRIKIGSLEVETTPSEIFEVIQGIGPALVIGLFDTLEQFRDRVQLFVNGEKRDINQERTRMIFSEFLNKSAR